MYISNCTAFELKKIFSKYKPSIAVLPVGSIEQHGKFLPLATDTLISEGIATHIDKFFNNKCFVYPSLYFSNADACRNFHGTVSISHNLFRMLLEEIIDNIIHIKFNYLIIVNSHGINDGSINEIIFNKNISQSTKSKTVIFPIYVYKYYDFIKNDYNLIPGKHADWMENMLVEYFLQDKKLKDKYALYSNLTAKKKNDRIKYNNSNILGQPIETRSRNGVIGSSLPSISISKELRAKIINNILHLIYLDINNIIKPRKT